jgi:TP901 family phage tail tape measure protein
MADVLETLLVELRADKTKFLTDVNEALKQGSAKTFEVPLRPKLAPNAKSEIEAQIKQLADGLSDSKNLFDSHQKGAAGYTQELVKTSNAMSKLLQQESLNNAERSKAIKLFADSEKEINKLVQAQQRLANETNKVNNRNIADATKAQIAEERKLAQEKNRLAKESFQGFLQRTQELQNAERQAAAERTRLAKESFAGFLQRAKDEAAIEKQVIADLRANATQALAEEQRVAKEKQRIQNEANTLRKQQLAQTTAQELASLQAIRTELKNLEATYRSTGGNEQQLANRIRELNQALIEQRNALPQTSRNVIAYNNEIIRSASLVDRLEGRIGRLSFGAQIQEATWAQLAASMSQLGPAGNLAGQALQGVNVAFGGISVGVAAATLGIGGLILGLEGLRRAGRETFDEIEAASDRLVGAGENLQEVSAGLDAITESSRLAQTFTEGQLLSSITEVVRANRDGAESTAILGEAIKLAAIEGKELQVVALDLSSILGQYGIEAVRAGVLTEQLAKASNLSKSDMTGLADGLSRVADQTRLAGFSMSETLGILVEMSNKGFAPAEEGSRALSSIISALNSPTEKARGLFQKLGIETLSAKEKFFFLAEEARNNQEVFELLGQILENFAERAIVKVTDDSKDFADQIERSTGLVDEMSEAFENNQRVARQRLGSAFRDLGATVNENLNPFLLVTLNTLTAIVNLVDSFAEATTLTKEEATTVGLDLLDNQITRVSAGLEEANRLFNQVGDEQSRQNVKLYTDQLKKLNEQREALLGASSTPGLSPDAFSSSDPLLNQPIIQQLLPKPEIMVDTVRTVDDLTDRISQLNDEIGNLSADTDQGKIASRLAEIDKLQSQLDSLLGKDKKSGSSRKTVFDELAEGTQKYRDGLQALVNARATGALADDLEILNEKLKINEGFVELLYTNYGVLNDVQKKQLTDAINLHDTLLQRVKELEDAASLDKLFTDLGKEGSAANREATILGTLDAQLDAAQKRASLLRSALIEASDLSASDGELQNLRERLALATAETKNLEAQIKLQAKIDEAREQTAQRIEDNKFFTRDSNEYYDPVSGQIRNLSEDSRAIAQSQAERDKVRKEEYAAFLAAAEERASYAGNRGLTYDPISGQLIDLGELKQQLKQIQSERDAARNSEFQARQLAAVKLSEQRGSNVIFDPLTGNILDLPAMKTALAQAGAENDAARNSEYQAFLQFRSQFEGFNQEQGVMYDPITGAIINLDELRRQLKQAQTERNIARREEQAAALASLEEIRNRQPVQAFNRTYDPTTGSVFLTRELQDALSRESEGVVESILSMFNAKQKLIELQRGLGEATARDEIALLEEQRNEIELLRSKVEEGGSAWLAYGEELREVEEKLKAMNVQKITDDLKKVEVAIRSFTTLAQTDFSNGNSILKSYFDISADIAALIPGVGPAIAGILRQVGDLWNVVLGDMSNGLRQLEEDLDRLADSNPLITEGTLKILVQTERVSRGGLLGILGLKKTQIDEEATNAAIDWFNSFANTLSDALTNSENIFEFRENFSLGLDKIIQQEMIKGFILTAAVQEQIAAMVDFVREALADGEFSQSERDAFEEMKDTLIEQGEQFFDILKEAFPELYPDEAAQDFGNVPQNAEADVNSVPPAVQFAVVTPFVEAANRMLAAADLIYQTFNVDRNINGGGVDVSSTFGTHVNNFGAHVDSFGTYIEDLIINGIKVSNGKSNNRNTNSFQSSYAF